MRRDDSGQATVELALVLPLVMLVILAGLQIVIASRNQVLLVNSARAAARTASTTGDIEKISRAGRDASPGLKPDRISFEITGERMPSHLVVVRATYRQPFKLPFAERLTDGVLTLRAEVAMPVEVP